jgi:hypothetical protein
MRGRMPCTRGYDMMAHEDVRHPQQDRFGCVSQFTVTAIKDLSLRATEGSEAIFMHISRVVIWDKNGHNKLCPYIKYNKCGQVAGPDRYKIGWHAFRVPLGRGKHALFIIIEYLVFIRSMLIPTSSGKACHPILKPALFLVHISLPPGRILAMTHYSHVPGYRRNR